MKKIITGALALSLISSIAMAEFNDIYVGGGIVYEKVDDSDAGKAIESYIGAKIKNNFGAEIRMTKTFSEAENTRNYYWTRANGYYLTTNKIDITTVGLYGTYSYNLSPELSIDPKVGFMYVSSSQSFTSGTVNAEEDNTESGLSYGVALKYNINNNWKTYASYVKVAKDVQHISIGVEKKF